MLTSMRPSLSIKHLALSIVLLLTACDKAEDLVSRRNPCRFYFYYEQHPTSLLFSAFKSAGMWVFVSTDGDGYKTERHVYVQANSSNAQIEDNVVRTDIERRAPYMLGASNQIGLIAGRTNFNGPWAYDRICPNCEGMHPLNWNKTNRQHVDCMECKREYDLETGNIVSGNRGEGLLRYNFAFDGSIAKIYN
jgi:hypothetical protein